MSWIVPIASAATLTIVSALNAQHKPIEVAIGSDKYRLIGKLHEPLGTVLTLQGVIVEGPSKGSEGGPNIRVQRINGRATQEDIQIKLNKGWTNFNVELPKLESGMSIELKGYETGKFVGTPEEALKALSLKPQVYNSLVFIHEFIYHHAKRIDKICFSPADFVDREVLIDGRAVSRDRKAFIAWDGWVLLVDENAPWPKGSEGKTAEGLGTVRKTDSPNSYRMEKGITRLVKLEDQLGRKVSLRGTAWSMNGQWWFNYRGTDLYVEHMEELPGWNAYLHGEAVCISGVLDEARLPRIDQISLKPDRDLKKYFIVRKASWKSIDRLLAPERVDR
jgi:hypothetical protein